MTLAQELFGKQLKDLNEQELPLYYNAVKMRKLTKQRGTDALKRENMLCYLFFGTTAKKLTPEQKRLYDKLLKKRRTAKRKGLSLCEYEKFLAAKALKRKQKGLIKKRHSMACYLMFGTTIRELTAEQKRIYYRTVRRRKIARRRGIPIDEYEKMLDDRAQKIQDNKIAKLAAKQAKENTVN